MKVANPKLQSIKRHTPSQNLLNILTHITYKDLMQNEYIEVPCERTRKGTDMTTKIL